MAPPTQLTWVWASSGSWWWTGKPGVLQSMELQRVGHNWATELNWLFPIFPSKWKLLSCVWFCDRMDYIVQEFQARILEWAAVPFFRVSSQSRNWTRVSCIAGGWFTSWATREALTSYLGVYIIYYFNVFKTYSLRLWATWGKLLHLPLWPSRFFLATCG